MSDQMWLPDVMRREAHEAIKPEKARLKGIVRATIQRSGSAGMTTDEVEIATGLSHQTASARVNELRNDGDIIPHGVRPTRSGRNAVVYRIASRVIR